MDIKKLNPWNWFSHEEERARNLPVQHYGVRRSYLSPLTQLHSDIDRMFESAFKGFGMPSIGLDTSITDNNKNIFLRPSLDIASNPEEYAIAIEVPGVDEKDIKLELSPDGTLSVSGEKKQEKEEKDKNFYRVERSYGSFQRFISLPDDVDQEAISASCKNGVLNVTIKRKAINEQSPAKQIKITKGPD